MTKDEYDKVRLTLAAKFASECKISDFFDWTPEDQRGEGWRPYGRMDWALGQADELLRAAGVAPQTHSP